MKNRKFSPTIIYSTKNCYSSINYICQLRRNGQSNLRYFSLTSTKSCLSDEGRFSALHIDINSFPWEGEHKIKDSSTWPPIGQSQVIFSKDFCQLNSIVWVDALTPISYRSIIEKFEKHKEWKSGSGHWAMILISLISSNHLTSEGKFLW